MAEEMRPTAISWELVAHLHSSGSYDHAAISELLISIGKPMVQNADAAALGRRLDASLAHYAFNVWRQIQPGPRAVKEQADVVSSACLLVLRSVGINPNPFVKEALKLEEIYPSLGPGGLYASAAAEGHPSGMEAVSEALEAVENLRRWSNALSEVAGKRQTIKGGGRRSGRPRNIALSPFFHHLTDTYFMYWDDLPSVSYARSTGTADDAEGCYDSGSLSSRMYETGEAPPVGFLRFLCEVFQRAREHGLPLLPENPSGIEKAWRRWRNEEGTEWLLPDKIQ